VEFTSHHATPSSKRKSSSFNYQWP
jgi:hypothetical protein